MRYFVSCIMIAVALLLHVPCGAQQNGNVWTLQDCVQFAIEHNISIKQDSINARQAKYTLRQTQLSQLPTVNASGSYGRSFGRSINPATNQFVDGDYNFLNPSGTANLVLFGWLQVRNSIERNKYSLQASIADLDQLKDDVSINVANSFLNVLLLQEQVHVSENQVSVSKAQLEQTQAFVTSGRLPELNNAQLESQLATDSSNLITAISNYNAAILDLKTLLNLDFGTPFNIQVPDMQVGDQLLVTNMQPEEIFQKALTHFGAIKASELRVKAADKNVAAAKGALYPQLSVGYQIGTTYATNYQQVGSYQTSLQPSGFFNNTSSGHIDTVFSPYSIPTLVNTPFGTQFQNNFRQTVFLNLNVPIFNGWQAQYNVKQAKINLETQQLNEYNAALTLKQNVYKAHNNAINSIQKFYAAQRAADAAQRALDFAKKRYDLGLTSTVDLLVTQNSAFAASSNLVGAKYDLIFKLKVIDYYLGKELKL